MHLSRCASFAVLLAIGLGGCATSSPKTSGDVNVDIDRQILDSAAKIQAVQTELYQAGVLSRAPQVQTGVPAQQGITLNWQGDALTLLHSLARDQGLQFAFSGVRQPLPVNVSVRMATFDDVLNQLRAQVGYRARLEVQGTTLVLQYNPAP
ncbi:DotD/TraH family lipoprotein [Achromobacter insuavis]|uniref:DotD/TraH family lipoprotein n=1 Tax=Achromobacter insuavis TaxID=1287735 RepID=UPI001F13D0C5|nr:DotD/TraH family lipoprotein [Achromobacter insuavis]